MKNKAQTAIACAVVSTMSAFGASTSFTSGEGYIDGNVADANQTGQTTEIGVTAVQGASNFLVSTAGTGTLGVPSQSFLRMFYGLNGAAMDIPTGGQIILDYEMDIVGEVGAPASNRIWAELALTTASDPGNPTTGNASDGIQIRSNGTNYTIDAGAFANDGGIDTGVPQGGPIDLSLVYTETSASSVTLDVFVNGSGTATYSETFGGGVAGNDIYAWINSSQGSGGSTAGTLTFESLGITVVTVPEPSSVLLLGLSGLALVRRRR